MSEHDDWRDDLRDWWDEDETASVESCFPIIARLLAKERARALRDAATAWDPYAPKDDRTSAWVRTWLRERAERERQ